MTLRRESENPSMTNPSRPALLQVSHLRFAYPGLPIVDDWSHEFAAGISLLRAPNGAGKSTLLKLMGGALEPAAGSLTVRGTEARADPQNYRRQVYWCGPEQLPFEHLTALEYFSFIRGLYPQREPAQWLRHAEGFKLEPHLHKPLHALSTGTQRKVALTAALSVRAAVVLLDEPLAALDRASIGHFATALADYATAPDTAWIMTSHEALPEQLKVHETLEIKPVM